MLISHFVTFQHSFLQTPHRYRKSHAIVGSHGVTGHPAAANFPPLPELKLWRDLVLRYWHCHGGQWRMVEQS